MRARLLVALGLGLAPLGIAAGAGGAVVYAWDAGRSDLVAGVDLAGKTIPPGPADPIKARWLGFWSGAGIHGTDALSSLGTAASHGCIRMSIADVIELYPLVPLGTPIFVG